MYTLGRPHELVRKLFFIVGMVGVGKTTRALQVTSERNAVRITPDEWMNPLFGQDFRNDEYPRRRDTLEGLLISAALDILGAGADVVLGFDLWAKDERSALRHFAGNMGVECEVVYVSLTPDQQVRRVTERWQASSDSLLTITKHDLAGWAHLFQPPTAEEFAGSALDSPPVGLTDWEDYATDRWPTLAI